MGIFEEKKRARDFVLTEDKIDKKLVMLSIDNVAKVEAMISIDSSYARGADSTAKPENNKNNGYKGSSAYWFSKFKDEYKNLNDDDELEKINNNKVQEHVEEDIILELVSAIDRENSTHLNSDGIGRREISDRIKKYTKKRFFELLKNADRNFELYLELAKITTYSIEKNKKHRKNPSFASKFCHYACFYLFENELKDNYSIYDRILREILPYYAKRYKIEINKEDLNKIKNNEIDGYPVYCKIVDNIIDNADAENSEKISRNGFDHLLWYYHKGRMYEFKNSR